MRPKLPPEALDKLCRILPAWQSQKTLPPEAQDVVAELCEEARNAGWTPEQLVVAVKEACYSSREIEQLTTTSERDDFLARIVTACIKEYFREPGAR